MNTTEPMYSPEELAGLVPDIRYDCAFKAAFTDEGNPKSRAALSGLLSAIIGRPLTVTRILQGEPPTGFIGEKQIRYDIHCAFEDGSRCNVEMTLHPVSCEAVRIEYYAAKAHIGQPTKGIRYTDIVPTYQVSILGETMLPDDAYLHGLFFYDPIYKISLGGRIFLFTVELPKVTAIVRQKTVRDMSSAERWAAYFLYNAVDSAFARKLIDEIAKEEEGVKMATEVLQSFSEDEKRYYRLLSEQKYEMDHYNLMADAEERGETRGIRIGEERGRKDERKKAEAIIADKDAEIARLRALFDADK
jgi:predicted transposase/invertase (TIGR01784 family)